MPIKSILVHFDVDHFSSDLAVFAHNLAQKFDAELIGFAACDLQPTYMSVDGVLPPAELITEALAQIDVSLKKVEDKFRQTIPASQSVHWRGFVEWPTSALCREARSADLIVTRLNPSSSLFDNARVVDQGGLVLGAGRPVLIAAEGATELKAEKILVGWKDTRESRRAVIDALPFLQKAKQVIVTTLDDRTKPESRDMLNDVVAYLANHGCNVAGECHDDVGNSGQRLTELAEQMGADMMVTGAFGHNRLREWAFGGVTRTLLKTQNISRFMSN